MKPAGYLLLTLSIVVVGLSLHFGRSRPYPRALWAFLALLPAWLFWVPGRWSGSDPAGGLISLLMLATLVPFASAQAVASWKQGRERWLAGLTICLSIPLWLMLVSIGVLFMIRFSGGGSVYLP